MGSRVLGVVAIGLSLLALGVTVLCRPQPSAEPAVSVPEAQTPPQAAGEDSEAQARLARIEMTLASVVNRVSALERAAQSQPASANGAAPAGSDERRALEALRADVDALLAGDGLGSEEGRERLKQTVRELQDEVFAERFQQRAEQRQKDRAERLDRLVKEARLTATQEADLRRLLDEEAQKRRSLIGEQFRPGQRLPVGQVAEDRRTELRSMRQATDEAAKAILGSDQYPLYEQMRQEDRRERRGPGGRSGEGGDGRQP